MSLTLLIYLCHNASVAVIYTEENSWPWQFVRVTYVTVVYFSTREFITNKSFTLQIIYYESYTIQLWIS